MPAVDIDLLLCARFVVSMRQRAEVLENHAIAINHGRIVEVLPALSAQQRYRAASTVNRPEHLLLPGLVNAHTHTPMSLFRGYAENMPLAQWLKERIWPLERRFVGAEFVRDGSALAIAEMLRAGISCFGDMYIYPDATAQVVAEQGMRAVIGLPVADFPSPWAKSAAEYLAKGLGVRDEYKGHPSITTAFAPHAPYTVGDEALVRIRTLADELDAGIMMHVHESATEIDDSLRQHGCRPLERLERLGLLTPAFNAIHMVHLNALDIETAQRGGVSISLCPESNLKLGNGPPPIGDLLRSGLRLGLGSDGAASNNDLDLWSEMKLIALLSHSDGAATATAWDALALATCGSAATLGREHEIGTLESGKWADICCVDLSTPAMQPVYDPLTQLVFSGGRDCVADVWVAGRQLLADGEFTRLDWPAVAARVRHWAARIRGEK
jgi:5-methylthioadenosine/S-adenosylhomocysteine deaminase